MKAIAMTILLLPIVSSCKVSGSPGLAGGGTAIPATNFDPATRPQDDFNQYANGGWIKANPVPAAYGSWGAFHEVDENNKKALRTILERAAGATRPGPIEKIVGDFYASGMDEAAIDAAGIAPLRPELDRIAALKSPADVQAAIARLQALNIQVPFYFTSEQDPKHSTMMIAAAGQAGLGLPDRDYYFRDDDRSKKIREAYLAHVAKMLAMAGDTAAAAETGARTVMTLETGLAKASKTRVELRDPEANYHKLGPAELKTLAPHLDWEAYATALGIPSIDAVDVGQPDFLKAVDRLVAEGSVADWRVYLRWHLVHAAAPLLGSSFVNENFDFYGRTLTGAQELRPRWKRVLGGVDESVGEALGQLYVAGHFPPESKARMLALVDHLRAALRERLHTLEWMDAPTRAKALEKLEAFGVKIGYPDRWIDYSALKVNRGPYVLNVLRAREFNVRRELAKIGKPVDRAEWGMSPPTVNAYYNPTMNEIVFPAGILQPPFFDPKADDAVNYGGIGGVIGHEMTHGFDDQGRQFDAKGNLTDWWTPECKKRFNERAAGIVKQFSAYVAIDDLKINGELTQGENIADLGGLKLAYAALQKALDGKSRDRIDGHTPEQRFFLGWATVWHDTMRPETMRLQVNTDPHSPARFRINGPLSNLPEFAAAFDVPEGSPMRRPASERVTIW